MPKNVLFFYPFDPFPTASGTQLRCIQMLDGLREFGYETTLLHRGAIREGPRSGPLFRRRLGYTPRLLDTVVGGVLQRIKWWRRGRRPATQSVFGSPGMRLWFRRAVEATSPDILWVGYAFCDNIVDHHMTGSMLRINDSIDLSSLHTQVYLAAVKYFPHKLCPAAIPDFAISEDFYRRLDIQASPDEFEIFDKYQQTIAISPRECEIIRANVRTTRVSYIPMTLEPRFV